MYALPSRRRLWSACWMNVCSHWSLSLNSTTSLPTSFRTPASFTTNSPSRPRTKLTAESAIPSEATSWRAYGQCFPCGGGW
uniref:Uncharacterized protein n=1 Tax=Arundo donax TaxID=35708 RepID=A0A0A8YJ25_ARUDO